MLSLSLSFPDSLRNASGGGEGGSSGCKQAAVQHDHAAAASSQKEGLFLPKPAQHCVAANRAVAATDVHERPAAHQSVLDVRCMVPADLGANEGSDLGVRRGGHRGAGAAEVACFNPAALAVITESALAVWSGDKIAVLWTPLSRPDTC
jgi:hypothetical protein